MSGVRSKRSAATAAESKISKFVEEEKALDRKSRSKKSKYDLDELDKDYFDQSSSDTSSDSEDSDSNHNCQPLSQKRSARGKKRKRSTELNKSPLWYR